MKIEMVCLPSVSSTPETLALLWAWVTAIAEAVRSAYSGADMDTSLSLRVERRVVMAGEENFTYDHHILTAELVGEHFPKYTKGSCVGEHGRTTLSGGFGWPERFPSPELEEGKLAEFLAEIPKFIETWKQKS